MTFIVNNIIKAEGPWLLAEVRYRPMCLCVSLIDYRGLEDWTAFPRSSCPSILGRDWSDRSLHVTNVPNMNYNGTTRRHDTICYQTPRHLVTLVKLFVGGVFILPS